MVGHIPRIICSAMIAVFVLHLQLGSFELHITSAWLRYKVHPLNKGCVIRNKTMHLTDEYALYSEVQLTRGLYGIDRNFFFLVFSFICPNMDTIWM